MELRRRWPETAPVATPLFVVALFPAAWALLGSFTSKDIVSPVPVLWFRPTLQNHLDVIATPAVRIGIL